MSFSQKKVMYGGLATACVALMVFAVSPYSRLEQTAERVVQVAAGQDAGAAIDRKAAANYVTAESVEDMRRAEVDRQSQGFDPSRLEKKEKLDEAVVGVAPPADTAAMADMVAPMEAEMAAKSAVPMGAAREMLAPPPPASPPVVSGMAVPQPYPVVIPGQTEVGRDKFKDFEQNAIKQVKQEPMSTFSIDVDTASYSFVRQSLTQGVLPQKDSVRIEELVNYFDYAYPLPKTKEEPFSTTVAIKDSPWNAGRKLMVVGIKGYEIERAAAPDSNLVFLLDVSGSMNEPNKLPLLKQSMMMLLESLKPTDRVSIVVYAGAAGMVLAPTEAKDKSVIINAIQALQPGGSTAGAEGIRLAYQLAEAHFKKDAVNRVILATDGDFNVGITSPDELQDFIERKRESGVFLSVLGFGTGNYNDDMMQRLAQNGNGVAAYIDNLNEARKVLVQEASATLFPIAKDVKIQVEFNPATVSEYRLVGYETRALKTEDFNNDKVDAGEIGAGAEVTAIYEITPVSAAPAVDASRYAAAEKKPEPASSEYGFLKIRYKLPGESTSKLITTPVTPANTEADAVVTRETNWAAAVAGFGQLIKGGQYSGTQTYDDILKLAQVNRGDDLFGYRNEFINLIYQAKTAAAMQSQGSSPGGPDTPVHYDGQTR